ncbi:ATP-binding cassette domain-containing protein [Streptomyces sparsogenes]|uniref:ABC transporter ATP-binding protein n=1 Tax=Streptomyces sparsogenes TaxID=67365 RepID=UPI003330111B
MRLHGVGRRYGLRGAWVLRGVDLDVRPGSLIRVTGGNGSGKSTLLRMLAGIDAPTSGRITGRPRTAYVPERFPAELPFTALGYLTHLGRLHGLRRAAAAREALEWLERFGADGHAHTPLAELSKGTSQKVAVAQALLAAPGLLVLDEAWTGLDQASRGTLDQAVLARVADGGAVVFVDHDPRRLADAADEVLRVADTRLVPAAGGSTGAPARGPGAALSPGEGAPGPMAGGRPSHPVREPGVDGPLSPDSRAAPGPYPGHPYAAGERGDGAEQGASAADGRPRIRVEAEGPPGASLPTDLPGDPVAVPGTPVGGPGRAGVGPVVRLTVGAAHSDALLRVLLTARPPWHIRAVAPVPAEAEQRAPRPVAGRGGPDRESGPRPLPSGRALPALLRYQAALLVRSQRWVPPVVLYGAFMAIGVMAGQPILDSFGYAAAALLPIAAWLVRVCVGNEPPAARNCAAAAAGPARVHLSSVLTGLCAAAGLGVVGAVFIALISDPKTSGRRIAVPLPEATSAGLLAALTCALLGAAVGALFSRPVLLSTGWGIQATALASLLVLVTDASPANAAVSDLVSGSHTGTVTLPLLPLAVTGAVAAGATALACALSSRRS